MLTKYRNNKILRHYIFLAEATLNLLEA